MLVEYLLLLDWARFGGIRGSGGCLLNVRAVAGCFEVCHGRGGSGVLTSDDILLDGRSNHGGGEEGDGPEDGGELHLGGCGLDAVFGSFLTEQIDRDRLEC